MTDKPSAVSASPADHVVTFDIRWQKGTAAFHYKGQLPCQGVVGIYGRNGAGKTTFVQLLAASRARQPLAGAQGFVRWGGHELWQPDPLPQVKDAPVIGMVGKDGALFPHLTVRQNLFISPMAHAPRTGYRRVAHTFAAMIGFRASRYYAPRDPALYDELIALLKIGELLDRRPPQLSAGEYQRVEWARTILLNPAAIFLDEPFAHLDWPSSLALQPFLVSLATRFAVPVFWISHNPHALIGGAAAIAVVDAGALKGVFAPADFARLLPQL